MEIYDCRKENRMNQVNYQKELEKILNTLQEKGEAAPDYRPPRLFLHSCCAAVMVWNICAVIF